MFCARAIVETEIQCLYCFTIQTRFLRMVSLYITKAYKWDHTTIYCKF